MSAKKVCPILSIGSKTEELCIKEACALWVELEKGMTNPFYKMTYKGCGLVNAIPWHLEKIEEKKK